MTLKMSQKTPQTNNTLAIDGIEWTSELTTTCRENTEGFQHFVHPKYFSIFETACSQFWCFVVTCWLLQ